MANILDIFKASTLNSYYAKSKENRKGVKGLGLASILFTPVYSNSFDLKIKNGNESYTPQVLEASNYDVEPTVRDFSTTIEYINEKPFFREKMSLNEKDRKDILEVLNRNNKEEIENISAQLIEQVAGANGFLGSVDAVNSLMVGQLLSAGVLKVKSNNIESILDYKLSNDLKETLTSTAKWSDTDNCKPLDDIIRWKEKVENEGGVVDLILLTSKVYNLLKNSKQVKELLEKGKVVFPSEIKKYIEEYLDLKFILWDEKVKNNEGETVNVFSDKVITLIPNRVLGKMEYAPTPIKTDKIYGVLSKDTQLEDLKGTYASLQVEPIQASGGIVKNIDIILSSVNAPNPNCLNEMFIGTVID